MQLQQLGYFVAVAEQLHFTRAAERLHVAQPALSRQIRKLEAEVGVRLLERTNRSVQLTAAGRAFLEAARQSLEHARRAAREARLVEQGEGGTLMVGFVSAAVFGVVPALLRRMRERFPSARVELVELDPQEQVEALRRCELDLGIMHGEISDPSLCCAHIGRERLMLALPERHPAAAKVRVGMKELAKETFFCPRPQTVPGFYECAMTACRKAGVFPAAIQSTRLVQTSVCLVAEGLGVAFVPESFRRFRLPGIAYRPLVGAEQTLELVLVWRRDNKVPLLKSAIRELRTGRGECEPFRAQVRHGKGRSPGLR
jgi:DNA-binding transcriptional LysR family regulator